MVMLGEKPWVKYQPETDKFGRFVVEPLERGFGVTMGNAFRRVLLSSLTGAAITAIKVDGVQHEFSTIPGVVEDMMQIILNLKEVVIKSYSDTPKVISLKSKGKGVVTAGDFEHDAEVEIMNPELVIATLESNGKLAIDATVERGKGYVTAEKNKKSSLPIGAIPIDSIFSPVLKVNISTEEVRVGQEINYDRLNLDVWTNGSVKPDEAVKESAKILARHVDMFLHIGERAEAPGLEVGGAPSEAPAQVLDMMVEDLELSARSSNCIKKAGIKTVREIIEYSEEDLMKTKNFGVKSLVEVREKLAEYKLYLKGEKPAAE